MSIIKSVLKISTTAVLASSLLISPVFAAKVLKLHHLNNNDPFDNPTGAMASVFKSLVESGTNGEIEVQLFPNSQLGKDGEVLFQVKAGVVQSGIHSVGGIASAYPLIGVLDVPFAYPNISATYKVFDGPFGDKLAADILAKTDIQVLGFGDSGGFFALSNSKREVRSPEDMKGLKIRTMGLDTHKAVIQSLGGQPAAIAWSEVYTALQTGVADGQMNPVPIISFAKFSEVQKYLTLTGHLFTPYVWTINPKFYNGLTAEQKAVINYAARSAIVAGRGIARVIEASERGLPALAKTMQIYTPTAAQKIVFKEASQPIVKKVIVEKYGPEGEKLMNEFLAAIEAQ